MGSSAPGAKSTVMTRPSLPGRSVNSLSISGVTTFPSLAWARPKRNGASISSLFMRHLVGFPERCGIAPAERGDNFALEFDVEFGRQRLLEQLERNSGAREGLDFI